MFYKTLLLLLFPSVSFCQSLHEKAIFVDTHNDVLSEVIFKGLSIETNLLGKAHTDLARWQKSGLDVQVFSIFCDETYGHGTAYKRAIQEIDTLNAIIDRNRDKMMLVTNGQQFSQAVKQHKIGCMIGVEGGHMIEDRMDYLDSIYNRGARYLTLTWNNSTQWASSAKDETTILDSAHPARLKGLTGMGKDIVRKMNAMGMMIDVSHLGDASFWDVIYTTTKPVIASHSSVYSICPFRRNLKDAQLQAIAKNGGVVQVNFYSGFLDSNYNARKDSFWKNHQAEIDSLKQLKQRDSFIDKYLVSKYPQEAYAIRPPLSLLIDHIEYIIKLIGIDHVGLGSDFDGIESTPQGIDGVQGYHKITEALQARGYSDNDIKKILGGNFIRVMKKNGI